MLGGLDGDVEVLLQLGLSGEIGQPPRAQSDFELRIFGLASRRKPIPGRACATSLPYQFESPPEERFELGVAPAAAAAFALRTAASACGRAQPRFSSAESTS